ncbi:MAG: protease inhibitor I42 family protein [bacterium]
MLTSSYSGGSGTVEKGDTISIVLTSNASTGYQWYLDDGELDEDVVSYTSRTYYPTGGTMLGAGGSEQWLFEAEEEGDTTIILEYRQSGSSIVSQTFTLDVEVTD